MIFNFSKYINEELKIREMDSETLEQVKRNLKHVLMPLYLYEITFLIA